MRILEISKLKKEFPNKLLFSDLSFTLNDKERIGLLGLNGVGKTTLLKMVLGQEEKDAGLITLSPNISVGYLSQEIPAKENITLLEYMQILFANYKTIQDSYDLICQRLETEPDNLQLLEQLGKYEDQLSSLGYNYEYQIDNILFRFGFKKEQYARPLTSFSGGECSKISFARLLLQNPDLLILDEPTNHLDIQTIEWLEDYLLAYQGAIIFVSHDRFFIDAIASKVLEISNGTASLFKGNYTYYLNEKTEIYQRELTKYNLQQREIKRLEDLIKKFMPKPTKVSFARQQENRLRKMTIIEKPKINNKKMKISLENSLKNKVKVISFEGLSVGFDDVALIKPFSDTIFSGEHLGIVGGNGTGKTTLLRSLFTQDVILQGRVLQHRALRIGYYEQELMSGYAETTVFDYFGIVFPLMNDLEIRSHLAKFLFSQDDVFKTIGVLSGGEKARLSFAKLLLQKYDLLVLDEPTNHLDLESKKCLEDALSDYSGTIIVVSHDRYFLDSVASKLYIFDSGTLEIVTTSYNEYYAKKKAQVIEPIKEITNKKVVSGGISLKKIEEQMKSVEESLNSLKDIYNKEENAYDIELLEKLSLEISEKEGQLALLERDYLTLLEEK